jgi:PIN domain nuclease of toxin-antitoxin system
MKLLLDTHTLLWWHDHPEKLSPDLQAAIKNRGNEVFISVVSAWEMQIKAQLNRLTLRHGLANIFERELTENRFALLTVVLAHVYALRSLPLYHSDPFDRLSIAQARTESLTLVSADGELAHYDVSLFW